MNDTRMCIEGLIGVLVIYDNQKADKACNLLDGKRKKYCNEAIINRNFGLGKDFNLYYHVS